MEYRIDTHIKAPKEKKSKALERLEKLFTDYSYWYNRVYVTTPTAMKVHDDTGYISWEVNGRRQASVSDQRLKELTRMLKDRAKAV